VDKEMMKQKLKEAFFKRMRALDSELQRRVTETEIAERMGCPQPLVSRWVSGKGLPSPQYIGRVAKEIPEIYEIMGLARPVADPDLGFINLNWERTPPEVRKRVLASIEKAVGDDRSAKTQRAVAAPKPGTS
jgi:transcriptional regulator with XRE-family HTH domain